MRLSFGKGAVTKCVAIDPDRARRGDHLVAEHVRQERGRGCGNQRAVNVHDLFRRAHLYPLGHVADPVGAVQRDRMAQHQMRRQAQLVDVVQAFADPKRGDRAAVQVHGVPFGRGQKACAKRSGRRYSSLVRPPPKKLILPSCRCCWPSIICLRKSGNSASSRTGVRWDKAR